MMQVKVKQQYAFSLTELMIVISIIAILTSIAAPSYTSLMESSKTLSMTSQLHAALLLARSEAIKRGRNVSICRSSGAQSAVPHCATAISNSTNNTGWGEGWLIYDDSDDDNEYTSADSLIRVQGPLIENIGAGSIIPVPNRNRLTFNSTGQIFGVFMRFVITRSHGNQGSPYARVICIASGGRIRVDRSSSCSAK